MVSVFRQDCHYSLPLSPSQNSPSHILVLLAIFLRVTWSHSSKASPFLKNSRSVSLSQYLSPVARDDCYLHRFHL
ncbi:hypothetical protein DFH94DRAFT_755669 [Russula ochroleuca]|uniref:Uncharacterized protein n=1 Tax=Russula ochroleuca TaxID=152965 RepID=A0A9P5T5X6_9AGAM|nr:hypothetical protein DFH94DRAFT_755669 [Russula ochroleuca]